VSGLPALHKDLITERFNASAMVARRGAVAVTREVLRSYLIGVNELDSLSTKVLFRLDGSHSSNAWSLVSLNPKELGFETLHNGSFL
jgi:hypothetical protein